MMAPILPTRRHAPSRPAARVVSRLALSAGWLTLGGLAGCGGGKPAAPVTAPQPVVAPTPAAPVVEAPAPAPAPPPKVAPVFGAYASRVVMVFPLQRYAVGDSAWLSASGPTGRPRAALVDSLLTTVLRERGLESLWSLPPNTDRVSQREVMNRTNPRGLSTVGLGPGRRPNDLDLREPLGSQLRALIALVSEARMVLLPVETRVAIGPDGAMRATLRLALIDGRLSRVVSFPDVTGAPAAGERAAVQSAVERFADMIVAP